METIVLVVNVSIVTVLLTAFFYTKYYVFESKAERYADKTLSVLAENKAKAGESINTRVTMKRLSFNLNRPPKFYRKQANKYLLFCLIFALALIIKLSAIALNGLPATLTGDNLLVSLSELFYTIKAFDALGICSILLFFVFFARMSFLSAIKYYASIVAGFSIGEQSNISVDKMIE